MFNFPTWNSAQSSLSACFATPATINYGTNTVQPMEIQITMHPKQNIDYLATSKDFIEKYFDANKLGIAILGSYYNAQSLFSINIHNNNQHQLFELVGHQNFVNKLMELGIFFIKYYDLVCTAQPIGKNRILITMHSKADIHGSHHNIITTIILKVTDGSPRIVNHILEIFI